MEDYRKNKTMYNPNNKSKGKFTKFWCQKQNISKDDIAEKIMSRTGFIKRHVDWMNGELKTSREKKKNYIKKNMVNSQRSSSIKRIKGISKNIILKIGEHINKIRQSIKDITSLNSLFLEDKAKSYYYKKTKLNLRKNKSASDIFSSNNSFYNDINNKNIKKDDYIKNFIYVNDNYRKQLNYAFLNFSHYNHLNNLKILAQVDPVLRRDIKEINDEIEEYIESIKTKYKKRLQKSHSARQIGVIHNIYNNNKSNNNGNKNNNNGNKNNNSLPKIKNENGKNKNKKDEKSVSSIYKKFKQQERLSKKEMKALNKQKEHAIEEYNYFSNALKEIDNLIKHENINDKIDMFKTDYAKKWHNPKNSAKQIKENLLEKDYFEKNKVTDKLGDIYDFQILKAANEKEKKIQNKIISEKEQFKKDIDESKEKTLAQLKAMRKQLAPSTNI